MVFMRRAWAKLFRQNNEIKVFSSTNRFGLNFWRKKNLFCPFIGQSMSSHWTVCLFSCFCSFFFSRRFQVIFVVLLLWLIFSFFQNSFSASILCTASNRAVVLLLLVVLVFFFSYFCLMYGKQIVFCPLMLYLCIGYGCEQAGEQACVCRYYSLFEINVTNINLGNVIFTVWMFSLRDHSLFSSLLLLRFHFFFHFRKIIIMMKLHMQTSALFGVFCRVWFKNGIHCQA